MAQQKILLLWERMGDYHRARWQELCTLMGSENCFGADLGKGDGLYHWANTEATSNYICLSNQPVNNAGIKEPFGTFKQFIKHHKITHVCIPGYGRPIYLLLLLWCRLNGIKVLMFAESWYPGNAIVDKLKGWFIKLTVHTVFASGKRAAHHFHQKLGINKKNILEGYSVVDNNHFKNSSSTTPTQPTLLCVARFAEEKNIELLINAFQQSLMVQQWKLKIVGGGPVKATLQEKIKSDVIELHNWLSYNELPHLYHSASLFILPSRFEPWGLVVNEAMAAGLPIILSDAVGALPDLLIEGQNGWCFENEQMLITILNQIASVDKEILLKMGEQSTKIVDNYSCQTWASKVFNWVN